MDCSIVTTRRMGFAERLSAVARTAMAARDVKNFIL
jgi:hypothetical protein